ncbi:MAG: beta-galactosidase, partial [Ruminococcaceae bacterium]|nr:beta-galactosidase [Oscillospiraceae bacterium]
MMRPEYPRPQLVREKWQNLNGEWDFLIDHGCSGKDRKFYENADFNMKINVPFAPESKLSGIEYVDFMKCVWYRRTFTVDSSAFEGRILIHFGAVDYRSEVWINGVSVGYHKGGYTPFVFDITDKCNEGENTVVVYAYDDTRDPLQARGKQSEYYYNHGCDYTRTTGIWQTVWLEFVPNVYISKLRLTPDIDNERLHVVATFNKDCEETMTAEASLNGNTVTVQSVKVRGTTAEMFLDIKDPELWSVDSPTLYDLKLTVGEDVVTSYFGMRKVAIKGYAIEINNKPVFQRLVLDQGFYPDGIYTAPTDEDLKNDIILSKAVGFNGARLHMKIFEPRLIYWADKLGYLLWGEYPNWGLNTDDPRALLSML